MRPEHGSRRDRKTGLVKGRVNKHGVKHGGLKVPSIKEVPTFAIQSTNSWMMPIVSFLQDRCLPLDNEEAKKIKKRAAEFTILNDTLYKRGFSMPYLKCVDEDKAKYILEEIHEEFAGTMLALDPL